MFLPLLTTKHHQVLCILWPFVFVLPPRLTPSLATTRTTTAAATTTELRDKLVGDPTFQKNIKLVPFEFSTKLTASFSFLFFVIMIKSNIFSPSPHVVKPDT